MVITSVLCAGAPDRDTRVLVHRTQSGPGSAQNGGMETDAARPLRVGLAQIDSTVGDLAGNAARMIEWIGRGRDERCDVGVFPELAVPGYPPEGRLLTPSFLP